MTSCPISTAVASLKLVAQPVEIFQVSVLTGFKSEAASLALVVAAFLPGVGLNFSSGFIFSLSDSARNRQGIGEFQYLTWYEYSFS